jgi:uridine kinase
MILTCCKFNKFLITAFNKMIIIGIAGGTGSGKTTVVKRIIDSLPKDEVALIPQDSYYKDSSNVPVEERQNINFDHPNAFDWDLLSKHIAMLKKGESIEQPIYSYLTCTRQRETIHVEPKEVIIIEGIMALSDKRLRNLMDLKFFVDADPDERLIRVIQRDVLERGRTAEAVMERYMKVLKPMHLEFIEPCKRYADLIIPQGGHNQKAIEIIKLYIEKILGK